jgi:TPP-dependent pyruvate/acetoin dehydrogenase alpha subunit
MVSKGAGQARRGTKEVASKPPKTDPAQPTGGNGASASNRELLRRLYVSMLRCRMLSERAQSLVVTGCGSVSDCDFGIGHEAIAAGATLDLGPEDTMVASPRNFAAQIAKGTRLSAAVRKNGDQIGIAAAGSMGSFDPLNLGTGVALAHRLEKKRNVVVALCAEDTPSPDRWHEAMKFAGIHKLPIIYVLRCTSAFETGAATKTPALEEISFMARDCGFPAVIVDGNDAVAVWRVTQESIHRARNGAGPTLIECETRFTQYRDPLEHMEHYMKKRGVWDDQWRREATDRIGAEIKAASAWGLDVPKRKSRSQAGAAFLVL